MIIDSRTLNIVYQHEQHQLEQRIKFAQLKKERLDVPGKKVNSRTLERCRKNADHSSMHLSRQTKSN